MYLHLRQEKIFEKAACRRPHKEIASPIQTQPTDISKSITKQAGSTHSSQSSKPIRRIYSLFDNSNQIYKLVGFGLGPYPLEGETNLKPKHCQPYMLLGGGLQS